ncbi:MAG: hypothetical protein H7257_10070 [Taibaiella sp.]|nr:hypothetical protein [Taibaiella sp.]
MQNRAVIYFSKDRARKIIENPLNVDLQTLLSATFALSQSRIVKKHIHNTLCQLSLPAYRLTA